MARIFISHSSRDNAAAVAIAGWLREEGWDDLFLDLDPDRGISAGERWQRALHEAANRCEAVLFLVSGAWLASRWCLAELQLAEKLNKRLFGVLIEELQLDALPASLIESWQLVNLARGSDHQLFHAALPDGTEGHVTFSRGGLQSLKNGLVKAGLDPRFFAWPPVNDPDRPPYRGLRPLDIDDAGIYFGREAQIIMGLDRLRGLAERPGPRLLAIMGASGAGKSSFLRAGLLARLQRDDRHFLAFPPLRPERAAISGETGLLRVLEQGLQAGGVPTSRAKLKQALAKGAEGLAPILAELAHKARPPALEGVTPPPPHLVLAIDQTEELFQGEGGSEADQLLGLIRALALGASPEICFIFTIRSDGFERLQSSPALAELPLETLSLPPMPRGAYQQVIEGPARRMEQGGRRLRLDPMRTEQLLTDIEAGGGKDALPLLAFTLERLFLEYGGDGDLTREEYRAIGGIEGSIEAAVERALDTSDPALPRDRPALLALLRRALIPWLAGIDPQTGAPRRRVGTVAAIGAAILDPINLLPVGGVVVSSARGGSNLVRGATAGAKAGFLSTTAAELALHGSQLTRTPAESAVNIGGGTILAGTLGGALSLFWKHPSAAAIAQKVEQEVMAAKGLARGEGGSLSAAAVNTTTLADETLRSAGKMEKALKFQDPMLRTIQSPSLATRRVAQELVELPLELRKNEAGVATALGGSVESRIKTWQAPLAASLVELDRLFVHYRLGREKRIGDLARIGLRDMIGRDTAQRMTMREFKAAVAQAMRRGDLHEIPEVQEAARYFRKAVFDPLKDRAIEAKLLPEGVEVKTAESYLSRVYDKQKIAARRPQFVRILAAWLREKNPDADALELERVADQIADRILGTPDGRIPYEPLGDITMGDRGAGGALMPGARGPAMARALDIRDELVEEFLENDVEAIARAYTRTLSADAELAARFGDPMMTRQMQDVLADYAGKATKTEASAAGEGWSAGKAEGSLTGLQKAKDADIRDLAAMRDRLRGTFALPRDPTHWASTAGRVVRMVNYLRLMGSVMLSSLPDIGRPVWVHGFRAFRQGLLPMVRSFGRFRAATAEVKLAGAGLDLVLNSRAMAIADVLDDFGRGSRMERGLGLANQRFGLVNLMAPWNAALQQFSGVVVMSRILEASTGWRAGKVAGKDMRALAAGGIDEDLARRIADQFNRFGSRENGLWLPDTSRWDDREAVAAFRAAVVRDVDRTIITPGQDKPLWLSTELGKVVGQFRSFAIASTQRVLLSGLQQRDAAALSGLVMMTGLGALRYGLYLWTAEKAVPDDWETWVIEGFDRAGIVGWLMEAHNGVEKLTGGAVGINALREGAQPMSRFVSRNQLDALLGPTFGGAKDAWDVLASTFSGNWSPGDVKAARRLLPLQNLFYARGLFDAVQEGLAGVVGVDLPE